MLAALVAAGWGWAWLVGTLAWGGPGVAEGFVRGMQGLYGEESARDPSRAVEEIVAAARAGDAAARTWLGHFFRTGLVVPYEPETAFQRYLEAALEDYPAAQYALATCYRSGLGTARSAEKADTWYQRAAQAAARSDVGELDADSLRAIGLCHRDGDGVARDAASAVRWLRRAVLAGQVEAMTDLADLYRSGQGVAMDAAGAAELYRQAAQVGSARAAVALARLHASGQAADPDPEQAIAWAELAVRRHRELAALGSVEDATALFELYADGALLPARPEVATAWLRRAAGLGYGRAITRLGRCHALGLGVPPDPAQALTLLQQAASQHEPEAHFLLWKLYRGGAGVETDRDRALDHLHSAAKLGHVTAMHTLGDWYRIFSDASDAATMRDDWYRRAIEGYRKLAGQGEIEAMAALTVLVGRGRGVQPDPVQSFEWMKLAANLDWPNAQYSLAGCYERGIGTDRDPARALHWYRRAARSDHVPALLSLAAIHQDGDLGTDPNPDAAYVFLQRALEITRDAAESGDPDAQYLLSSMLLEGMGTPPDPASGLAWLHRAGHNDHPTAQLELGSRYSLGDLLHRDLDAALFWIGRSARLGNPEAQYLLGKAYDSSDALERDYSEAYKWLRLAADQGFEPARLLKEELEVTLSRAERQDALTRAREFNLSIRALGDDWIEAESFTR